MPSNAENPTELTKANVNAELKKWKEMDVLIQPTHPRFAEYQKLAKTARELIARVGLALTIPQAGSAALAMSKQAAELYLKAVEIRASMFSVGLRNALKLAPGVSVESALMKNIDPLKDIERLRPIANDLELAAKGLEVNPADVLNGSGVNGNIFFEKGRNGQVEVNYEKVNEVRETVKALKKNGMRLHPSVAPLVRQMETGIRMLEAVNPVKFAGNQWYNELKKSREWDSGPLRLVLGMGGGLLSALGLAYSLSKGTSIQWPTYMWAGISAYSLYPDLLAGAGKNAQKVLENMNSPQMHELFGLGFKGPQGVKAFKELQEMDTEKRNAWQQLTKTNAPINGAQLGFVSKKGGALEKVMLSIPEGKRAEALRNFGAPMNSGDRELMEKVIESRA